jgi:alanyl-tRNA synthetase
MRRAIHQGRRIGIEGDFLGRFGERVRELMGSEYPELHEQQAAIDMWLATEEESFGRTIERGLKLLDEMVERAREEGAEGIGADNAFRLHDTFGFPIELTTEIAAERGLGVDQQGFEDLMEQQRKGSQATAGRGAKDELREAAMKLGGHSEFVGYETLQQETEVVSSERLNGSVLVKLEESPFYAEGGGQVSDAGDVDGLPVGGVLRVGDDQVLVLDRELQPGTRVIARVDPAHRRPTECNHTATHLLHAALRERLGAHVRQAGSYVGPDKLRFDFTHGAPLEHVDVQWVEDKVNQEILANQPVRAITTTLEEAKALGAMALFGEKYGDVVRMVEIGDGNWSRELCGGTHVRATAEIGTFRILSESSSAANVRRIEAVTGPVAVELLRRHDGLLRTTAALLRGQPEDVPDRVMELRKQVKELEKQVKEGAPAAASVDPSMAVDVAGTKVLVTTAEGTDPKSLPDLADRLKNQLGDAAVVVLGVPADGKVSLIVSATQAAVDRGVKAGDIVKLAAGIVGGGGGGRPTMAQAGGKDPSKLPDALEAARAEITRLLG